VNNSNSGGISAWSNSYKFYTKSPFINITFPNGSENIYIDSTYVIRWQSNVQDTINIDLIKDNNLVSVISDSIISGTNALIWKVPTSVQIDSAYKIRITSINHINLIDFSDNSFSIVKGITNITDLINYAITYSLSQNYPNPFNPSTVISWQIPEGSNVSLKVYNILGSEITTLINEYKPAGKYETEFKSSSLPSGIYFYKLQAGNFVETKKMILMK
jgi:hypothetical protein